MYEFHLTEEISRWAFEIVCQNNKDWFVAFTNPTAGPWKTIKGRNKNNKEGEIYRFDLEEKRPDIVLVNDNLKVIIIFEAKDSLPKLLNGDQVPKSVKVVSDLSKILTSINNPHYWGQRKEYQVVTGLLWGAEEKTTLNERAELLNTYFLEMKKYPTINKKFIVGIETRKYLDGLKCYVCDKVFDKEPYIESILDSFNLERI